MAGLKSHRLLVPLTGIMTLAGAVCAADPPGTTAGPTGAPTTTADPTVGRVRISASPGGVRRVVPVGPVRLAADETQAPASSAAQPIEILPPPAPPAAPDFVPPLLSAPRNTPAAVLPKPAQPAAPEPVPSWPVPPLTAAATQAPGAGVGVIDLPPLPDGPTEDAAENILGPVFPYVPHLGGAYAAGIPYATPVFHDPTIPEEEESICWRLSEGFIELIEKPHEPMAEFFAWALHTEHDETPLELNPYAIGLQPIPPRPPLIVELNEPFLGPGFLSEGYVIPTGTVWRPSFWVWGEYRTHFATQSHPIGRPNSGFSEWANRLDLFGQLNLSGTERIVAGIRPLDEQDGPAGLGQARQFVSYDFWNDEFIDGWMDEIQTLFFEGDLGEIFPYVSPYDFDDLDYGFSVGRQPMIAQQGLLIAEDRMDAVTLTRNTVQGFGVLNMRSTAFYAWGDINRHDLFGRFRGNYEDDNAQMVGLLTESDLAKSTVNVDMTYLHSDIRDTNFMGRREQLGGSLFNFAISSIQRIRGYHNTYNSSAHFLLSVPTDEETTAAGQGELLFHQLSWTPHNTEDLVYVNTFWAIDEFTAPARGPLFGGPVGLLGLTFSHAGLGQYVPPLPNQTTEAVGGSIGYQMFFDETREQVTVEVGARTDTNDARVGDNSGIALASRYQKAMGQHWIWLVEGFVAKRESVDTSSGARTEILLRF